MRTERDELLFAVSFALGQALSSMRGMKKALTDEERKRVAEAIVHHLETTNWKVTLGNQLGRLVRAIATI
jgi:hypothetical protein